MAWYETTLVFLGVTAGIPLLGYLIAAGAEALRSEDARRRFGVLGLHPALVFFLGLILVLVALILLCGLTVLILLVMGLRLMRKQTDTATEALLNEKINAAMQGPSGS
ncbi:MAG: hypothetical protein AAGM84_02020 [Pseudomonadota bacterium]